MQKRRHSGKKQQTDLKRELGKYLKSETFQKAFERMVSKTIENGTEHGFRVMLWFTSGQPKFGVGLFSGGSPNSLVDAPGLLGFDSSEFCDSFVRDFIVSTGNESGDEGLMSLTPIIDLHTHPFVTKFQLPESKAEMLLSDPAAVMLYSLSANVPSRGDVEALAKDDSSFGMIVPVNIISKELHILVYQNVTPLSYVAYENLWEEVGYATDFDRIVLNLAVERSILRVLELRKRKKAIITSADVDLFLKTMDLKNSNLLMNCKP